MRAFAPPKSLAYLWLAVLAGAAAMVGFPDVAAVARSQRPARPARAHSAVMIDATRAILTRGAWRLRFDDEFDRRHLNLARWQPNWLGADAMQTTRSVNTLDLNCVSPDEVRQDHGDLGLSAVARSCATNGRIYRFASGLVNTSASFHFTYGLLEARIYIPPAHNGRPANFPAFWALGYGSEPRTGELDVMEALGGCGPGLGWHFHGTDGAPGRCVSLRHSTGWHVFAADWEPKRVTFLYDGRDVGEVSQGVTHAPMYLVLNNSVDPSYGGSSVSATMRVDWVRVYQRAAAGG